MRQGLEALRVPSKAAILCHLNNMGLSAILAHKAATGLKGGAHNIAQAGAGRGVGLSLLVKPPYSFVCMLKGQYLDQQDAADMLWWRPSNQRPPVLQKFISARCVQSSYIKFPCPYSRWLRSLSKARGHSGTPTHRLTAKQKSSPNRGCRRLGYRC